MSELRAVYAQKGLCQIPRLLSLQDRNPYSPTYGCFKRTYWLDKTADFPDALPQFGVLSLALAYAHPFFIPSPPEGGEGEGEGVNRGNPHPSPLPSKGEGGERNIYYQNPKVREWVLAGMRYWTTIQHRDGSFDEFYPNEHGWTGPTGFLLYAMLKSYLLLDERKEFPEEFKDEFFTACRKAADYIIEWDEHGVLANHHAMAVLPVYYAYHVFKDGKLLEGYEKKLTDFLKVHTSEGWSLEYDGADPGYLSATVSFLGKVYKLNHDERLKKVMQESIEFLSIFVYPNGFYAGSMGSRNTLHFYPHGCEILASEFPLAGRVADRMLESLRDGKIVPAEIMGDRYFLYRIPEHLESYIDYAPRSGDSSISADRDDKRIVAAGEEALLPYERDDFRKVFPLGRFYVQKKGAVYFLGNAAKGGVVKVFKGDKLFINDCGIIGQTVKGNVLTSQWIDPDFTFKPSENGFSVSGSLHRVPSNKLFTPVKFVLFRLFLVLFGWHTGMAYRIKGLIRKLLMLSSGVVPVEFQRHVELGDEDIRVTDILTISGNVQFDRVQLGDEFFVRYVPQSRYFQSQELGCKGYVLHGEELKTLNGEREIRVGRVISLQ